MPCEKQPHIQASETVVESTSDPSTCSCIQHRSLLQYKEIRNDLHLRRLLAKNSARGMM